MSRMALYFTDDNLALGICAVQKQQNFLLIPGLCCTDRLFREQVDSLSTEVSLRVCDEHTGHEDIQQIAKAILASAPDFFALAGLSFGGYVCFEIWRQAPERITHLAFLNTSARQDTEDKASFRRDMIALAERGRFLGIPDRLWPTFIDKSRHGDIALVADIKQMALDVGAEGFLRQQKAIMSRPDSLPTLPSITCPTLVLVGANDQLTPVTESEIIHDGITGSELVVIPGCGHLSTMEMPKVVTQHLRQWLMS